MTTPPQTSRRLTAVQRRVLEGEARVGRGLPFKCNRLTARALRSLRLVGVSGPIGATLSREDEATPFTLTLTPAGRAAVSA